MSLFLLHQYIILAILIAILINFIANNIIFKNTKNYKLPKNIIDSPPLVSVLIPARNEEKNIYRCLRSLAKQDYPNLEILVLDDKSKDATASVVEKFASKDRKVKLIAGKPLKAGWLGKSYACHQLSKNAKGDYLVFVDADTLHFPDSISSAIASLICNGLDAISVVPLGLIKKTRYPLFCTAIGQFMLFKRNVYEEIGGHESVKGEILDDIHISKQVKRCGYKFMIFDGRSNVYCRMYRSLKEVVRGFSKVISAAFNYNFWIQSICILLVSIIFLFPFILLPMGIFIFDWARILIFLNIMQIAVILIIRIVLSIRFKNRILDMLLFHPFAIVYITLISMNSYLQAKFGEGVYWKDRVYDVSEEDELNLIKDNSD
jgi:chlorobactene glucosyltransferase